MVVGGLYRTVTWIFLCRADKRIVSASAPLPLISATVEVGAFIFQRKSGSAQRSRDRKEAAGGMKRGTDSYGRDAPRSKYPWGAPRNDRIGFSTR